MKKKIDKNKLISNKKIDINEKICSLQNLNHYIKLCHIFIKIRNHFFIFHSPL
jgi:hypothetical protein